MPRGRRSRDAGRRVFAGLVIVAIALISAPAPVADASPGGQVAPDAADIIERSHQAYYYAGDDMKARMTMELIGAGARRGPSPMGPGSPMTHRLRPVRGPFSMRRASLVSPFSPLI